MATLELMNPLLMDMKKILLQGHSGEYGNAAKLVGKMSKSVMQLIAIHFLNWF